LFGNRTSTTRLHPFYDERLRSRIDKTISDVQLSAFRNGSEIPVGGIDPGYAGKQAAVLRYLDSGRVLLLIVPATGQDKKDRENQKNSQAHFAIFCKPI
jgi:hypothetical protein